MKKDKQFIMLDCTVRDGGYINNWAFPIEIVASMYKASSTAGVEIFEIGFLSEDTSLPLWRQSPAWAVKQVTQEYQGAQISAILEANTVGMKLGIPEETGIDVLRIALNKDKVVECIPKMADYKAQGYTVFVQLMGITGYTDIEILNICKLLDECGYIDYINIGDSYGSLLPERTTEIISMMKRNTRLKVGLHAHNNMQLGMANVLAAVAAGANIVDGSLYGMGRGGGNVPLELLLSYYGKKFPDCYDVLPVLDFIDRYMIRIRQEFEWGYTLNNLLSGVYECHPYYTSKLIDKREYTIEQVLKTVKIVSSSEVIGFSDEFLNKIIESGLLQRNDEKEYSLEEYVTLYAGHVPYTNRYKGRDFLILGNGPTLIECKETIDSFIQKHNPVVLGANNLSNLYIPDYHAFNNQRRFEQYGNSVHSSSKLLLGPSINAKNIKYEYEPIICYNSPLTPLKIIEDIISSNCRSISVLLGAIALVMGARNIYFAGMDGYLNQERLHFYDEDESQSASDLKERHDSNQAYLGQLGICARSYGSVKICFITPTTYEL
ncbi:aldolase catalytic domain-containing protein [Desulfitobacterium hafniense]|uniref:Pyruvate carboxyltransferase domain-containing protein n=1 Tax=Desulfitobacterium hafniense (strain Y51) TaxID=138119 RepID=Q24S97_DESHY|nr:aldolase catalytic domain-containing protein [Desulfitobacterium hafniense]BAE85095.1 hypothetical protein DSY3306 [Desulfitobacterium hafniense Y51]